MKSFLEAVEACYTAHWAGAKDGERSRDRALSFMEVINNVNMPTRSMSPGLIRMAITDLKGQGRANGTINRHLAAFCTVWRFAHQNGEHPSPPPSGMYLKESTGRTRVVSETELGGLVAELPPAHQGLAVFLYEVGCRVSEALKLERRDVDLLHRRVTFRNTKTGDDRAVPLTTRAQMVLRNTPPTLFSHLSQSAWNHAFAEARARMGLVGDKEFCPHALRHGAVTRWIVAGIPLPIVSQMAGHRSYKTTARYAHPTVEHAQQALEKAGLL